MEAQLLDQHTHKTHTQKPTNQTAYRQSLFTRAKESATQFLGKFYFGRNTLTEVLPPVIAEAASIRDGVYALNTGTLSRLRHHHT